MAILELMCKSYREAERSFRFFALSGYLMTMMLGKSSQLGVAEVFDFFYRRVKRIVPLYYLTTLLILGTAFIEYSNPSSFAVRLYFAPISLQEANLEPALASIAFITNLERPDAVGGYFEKVLSRLRLYKRF